MISHYSDLVHDIILYAHKFYQHGYEMSDGGNLSIRIPDKSLMIVKGTNVAFDEISEQNLVITDFDGNLVEGNIRPSKEALLHGAIYKTIPRANAIMHCHSPYAIAWAFNHNELTFATHHSELKLGGKCPVFDTHSYAVSKEYFPQITGFLKDNINSNGLLLRAHGQLTIGSNMRKAAYLAELVEETAKIDILSS